VRDRGEVVVVIYPRERKGEERRAKESLGIFFREESLKRKEEK
jgi:hypothetical protein